jgi:hypothetical protein
MYQDKTESIETLFTHKLFQIPDYQRGYAWEERQWQDLKQDLELLPLGRDHYTGTVVLHMPNGALPKSDRAGNKFTTYDIVDGQQRLTTLVILIDAIRREMLRFPALREVEESLEKTYIRVLDSSEQHLPKLQLNSDCHDFYYGAILEQQLFVKGPEISAHRRLQGAKKYYSEYLMEQCSVLGDTYPDWLKEMSGKIRHHLKVLIHCISQEADAGVIFETMNNRGKLLTEMEKTKNYLLYLAHQLNIDEEHAQTLARLVNATWTTIFRNLMSYDMESTAHEDSLLRTHWLVTQHPDEKRWKGVESVKRAFDLRHENYRNNHILLFQHVKQYLATLQSSAVAYCDVYRASHSLTFGAFEEPDRMRARQAGKQLERSGSVATFLPLLLALRLKHPANGKLYAETAELCEKFAFRVYRVARWQTRTARTKFLRWAYHLFSQPGHVPIVKGIQNSIRDEILHNYCSDAQFRDFFSLKAEENDYYRWHGLSYFLYEFERHKAKSTQRELKIGWSELVSNRERTIEHILPQTVDAGGYWRARFSEEAYKKYVHDIGNLSLTRDNSWLSNRPFPEKKGRQGFPANAPKGYINSDIETERRLADYSDWTEEELLKRRQEMVEWALQRWQVDPPESLEPESDPVKKLIERAMINGMGEAFEKLLAVAVKHGLYLLPNKHCVQFRPPHDWRYSLITIYPSLWGGFYVMPRPHNFERAFGVQKQEAAALLGKRDYHQLDSGHADEYAAKLDQLLSRGRA